MLNCHIVEDLLPSYVDGLVSEQTKGEVQQHLEHCSRCRLLWEQLKAPMEAPESQEDDKEINFLKKIRMKTRKRLILGFTCFALIFAALTYFLAIGVPLHSADIAYKTHVEGDEWTVSFTLTNEKKELLMRTAPLYTTEASGRDVPTGVILTPYGLIPSPIMDGHSDSFRYSCSLDMIETDFVVILKLADQEILITKDNFTENFNEPVS